MSPTLSSVLGTFRLGIDFGTSNTVAMLGRPDGRARSVLFDGAPILPSAVFADRSGELAVGRDALNAALSYPEGFEPYPKRRIDDGALLLGEGTMPVSEAIAAVLRRVAAEAQHVAGQWPTDVVLTYPASWGPRRRRSLLDGAERAGVRDPHLVPEPLAAAFHFAHLLGHHIPAGGHLLVYDFGAGTFDASVVHRTAGGFAVVASEGLADTGGLDVDAAIVAHLGAVYSARYPDAWRRLQYPSSPPDRRHSRQLWDSVRAAKEALTRTASALVHIPVLEQDAPITREQLDELARPIVDRTVTAARGALLDTGVDLRQLAGVILVGGASRMPIVATQLHRVLGIAPTVLEQPELVVAEGSLLVPREASGAGAPARDSPTVVMRPVRAAEPRSPRRRRSLVVAAAVAALVLVAGTGLVLTKLVPLPFSGGDRGGGLAGDADFRTPGAGSVGNGAAPSGTAPAGATPSGNPAPTTTGRGTASPRPGGGTAPKTTAARPGGITGSPVARHRNSDPPLECEGIGIPLTNSAKSGRLPEVLLDTCTGGPTVKSSGGWDVTWFIDYDSYSYKSRMVVELYECGGGLVKKVDTGVVEKSGSIHHDARIDTTGYSGQHYTRTKLMSLSLRLDGVLWTNTSNPVVTSACTTI